jgi:hypothetical protein
MQSQKEYPADMANCKDKFLVQSCCVSADKAAGDVSGLFSAEGGPSVTEAKLRVSYVSPAPPPSPVAEEGEPGNGGSTPSKSTPATAFATFASGAGAPPASPPPGERDTARAEAAVAARERTAALDAASKLQRELAALAAKHETLKAQLAEKDVKLAAARASAPARALVPFTLLHILLTAIIAFCLGRYL